MRVWKKLWDTLTREPRGFNADGRVIGLGLHTAQRDSDGRTAEQVETYLRNAAAPREQLTK